MGSGHHVGDRLGIGDNGVLHGQFLLHRQLTDVDGGGESQIVHGLQADWLGRSGGSPRRLGEDRSSQQSGGT